ncbi:MAG TPA: hypothetical protein VGV92_05080 [Gammaproteobacteria bacterium]|nr:hypothetical protein [Gammaproteobacteria bacterium]
MEDPDKDRPLERTSAELREEDKQANYDDVKVCWTNFVQELFKSFLSEHAKEYNLLRFLNVMDAAAEFIHVCYLLKKSYTPEERRALLTQLSENVKFDTVDLEEKEKAAFFRQLHAFISGTLGFFHSLSNDEDGEYFERLCEWIPDTIACAIPSYVAPQSDEKNTVAAREYCEDYRKKEQERLATLKRTGNAIALYVHCHSLQFPNSHIYPLLPKASAIELRVDEFRERYIGLRTALCNAGRLSPDLNARLVAEEAQYIKLVQEVDHLASTPFTFTAEIHAILAEILQHDKASVLRYYAEYGKKISHPERTFYEVLAKDYYALSISDPESGPEQETTRVITQAPITGRALLALGDAYEKLFFVGNRLLGENNRLDAETLGRVLAHFTPLEQREILEKMYKIIFENENNLYTPDLIPSVFNKTGCTRLQLKHIKLLQSFYFEIIRNNPTELIGDHVNRSLLLTFKLREKDKSPQEIAQELLREALAPRSPRLSLVRRDQNE